MFRDLGCDGIISGGQTMNPSTESILDAIDRTPAEVVFVLPNNKNIIMAAQQCQHLSDKQIVVIPSASVPQGMAAMLAVGLFCGWALSGPRAAERFAFITGSSISSFELPDGSRITLDKESRLEYDGDFGRDERNVRLVGKGFFEVEKMPDKRFVVEMGDVQVSVLGTTFDASNRTEEGIVSASLVEGSVAFRAGNQNLRLTPSRRAVYHVGSGEITVSEFDPEITTAWKDNLFRYKSLTLEEVLEQLSARYDVRIITDAGDVGRTRFSGALETRLSVEQALDIVSRQTGMEWSKLDNVYFVTKR